MFRYDRQPFRHHQLSECVSGVKTVAKRLCAISAVVCTQNRSDYLVRCLAALERQTLAPDCFEVVVVDNGSKDDTPSVIASFCERLAHFKRYFEPRPGLSIARNSGTRMCAADIVAFTDDDAEPDPAWLEGLLFRFREGGESFGIVGGDVIPVWGAPRPAWLTDQMLRPLSAGLKWSTEARLARSGEWLIEVNSAYRKSVLDFVGGFPEKLGRVGDLLLSGDGVVNQLIEMAGFSLFYDPAILVRHHISANRLSREWFRKRSFWQGVTLNRCHRYVLQTAQTLGLDLPAQRGRRWEEIIVPTSALAWADLFDENSQEDFSDQLYHLEQLGFFLESQRLVIG
ncbi:MAG: glycosyltransferase [Methanobacterium sp.]|nr:glycosyltransferase [Methanobacterium sp.]